MALFVIAIVVIIVCKISDYNKEQKYLKSAQCRKVLKEHPEFRTPKGKIKHTEITRKRWKTGKIKELSRRI